MIETTIIEKKFSDKIFENKIGTFFDESYYDIIINNDHDCYFIDNMGNMKILFKIRKKVVKPKMHILMREIFEKYAKKQSNQRAKAAGGERILKNNVTRSNIMASSSIVGYYDRAKMPDRKYFKTNVVCRKTSFTRDNVDSWNKSISFFKLIAGYYKKLAPLHYKMQQYYIRSSPYKIDSTPFTTVTTNYNWRTACHKDKGDYSDGMGNLVVLGENFGGCYLGFPQFKIAINTEPGDLVIMNVHEWHCNTELILYDNSSVRLSFVCYMRRDMALCNKKIIIGGEEMYYKV